MKQRKITAMILVASFIGLSIILITSQGIKNNETLRYSVSTTQYIDRTTVISIDGNTELKTFISNEGLSGQGTALDPYIISGYNITLADETLISIKNTNTYLIIKECFLKSGDNGDCGILLDKVANVVISNNTIVDDQTATGTFEWWSGIEVEKSEHILIVNNTIMYCGDDGIYLSETKYSIVEHNYITKVESDGIDINYSNDLIIRNNIMNITEWSAVDTWSSNNLMIISNEGYDNDFGGIELGQGTNIIVAENLIDKCVSSGIYLYDTNKSIIKNNVLVSGYDVFDVKYSYENLFEGNIGNYSIFDGIEVRSSESNSFLNNTLANNGVSSQDEIFLDSDVNKTTIKYNNFITTTINYFNDSGSNNVFDYNHYSEHTSPDTDSDGIVDTSYSIGGLANNEDLNATVAFHSYTYTPPTWPTWPAPPEPTEDDPDNGSPDDGSSSEPEDSKDSSNSDVSTSAIDLPLGLIAIVTVSWILGRKRNL